MKYREIKFRAYIEGEIKKMMYWDDLMSEFDPWEGTETNFDFYVNNDMAIMMQYTGLKDKNGKEIYEGDILKNTKNHNQLVEVYWEGCVVDDVKWIQWGGWGFRKVKSDKNFLYAIYDGEIEVIGNIYENPELLKEKK